MATNPAAENVRPCPQDTQISANLGTVWPQHVHRNRVKATRRPAVGKLLVRGRVQAMEGHVEEAQQSLDDAARLVASDRPRKGIEREPVSVASANTFPRMPPTAHVKSPATRSRWVLTSPIRRRRPRIQREAASSHGQGSGSRVQGSGPGVPPIHVNPGPRILAPEFSRRQTGLLCHAFRKPSTPTGRSAATE
jgi:hypothetical protein